MIRDKKMSEYHREELKNLVDDVLLRVPGARDIVRERLDILFDEMPPEILRRYRNVSLMAN